ncbi:type IX secretion system plug protein [Fulvivirga lutea]|uniref:DUF5103 domain-containing protein n=1 Tax=Fulvivirga lutea TaxID=2810512 RepID=A0A974WFN3_9BACT|nr:DUF5103 domain-containing protein [Fulvivirga lutea]QSE96889.1 DUF5103 domain-containing protein [Fulvivirga lutea]
MINTGISTLFLFCSLLIGSKISPQQSGKKLLYEDATYEEEIRTVLLYPNSGNPGDVFLSPVDRVGSRRLTLEFDDLVEAHEQYRVKLIHCNRDWTPSGLRTLDYLYDFNEFNITQYEYSTDTKIGYIHYTFRLPPVKQSGNYLLVAYRGSDEKDIILTKRFMIYNQSVSIEILSNLNGLTSMKRDNQQIDFKINYEDIELINPLERIRVVLRQNQQWYNAITIKKPSFFRNLELEYRFFNFENNFSAGNEYRFFDMRSLRYPGQNIEKVDLLVRPSKAYIMTDGPRIYQAYAQYDDINGNFYIQNQDTGGSSESDYLYTKFSLALREPIGGTIHVVGKMNDYKLDETTQLTLDNRTRTYTNTQLLKQGFYNYKYVVKSDTLNYNYLEGNHFETENQYEIFVYYSPPDLRGDLLVGYSELTLNERLN